MDIVVLGWHSLDQRHRVIVKLVPATASCPYLVPIVMSVLCWLGLLRLLVQFSLEQSDKVIQSSNFSKFSHSILYVLSWCFTTATRTKRVFPFAPVQLRNMQFHSTLIRSTEIHLEWSRPLGIIRTPTQRMRWWHRKTFLNYRFTAGERTYEEPSVVKKRAIINRFWNSYSSWT